MEQNIETFDREIGRIKGEGIVYVDVRLEWQERGATTIDHQTVEGFWRFAVTGSVWLRRNSQDCHTAGQIIDTVRKVRTPLAREIVRLWKRWHLNDMHAGCVHQTDPPRDTFGSVDLDSVPPCPETGYRYGHAWLVEVIPDAELDAMRRVVQELQALPRR